VKGSVKSTPTAVTTSYNIQLLEWYSSKDTQIEKEEAFFPLLHQGVWYYKNP
jgi:hypothetical protein